MVQGMKKSRTKFLLVVILVLIVLSACVVSTTGSTPAPTPDIVKYIITVDRTVYRCRSYSVKSGSYTLGTKVVLYGCEGYLGLDVVIKDYTAIEIWDVRE